MKITDLMIGDLVQYKGNPVKVHALNVSNGYAIMEDQVSIELSKDTCMSIDAKRLEPIPLTEKIIQDSINSFTFGGGFEFNKPERGIYCQMHGELKAFDGYIRFVHEFQHVITLIEASAELIL